MKATYIGKNYSATSTDGVTTPPVLENRVTATYVGGDQRKLNSNDFAPVNIGTRADVVDSNGFLVENESKPAVTTPVVTKPSGPNMNFNALGAGDYAPSAAKGYNPAKAAANTLQKGLTGIAKAGSSALAFAEDAANDWVRFFYPEEVANKFTEKNQIFNKWDEAISADAKAVDEAAKENLEKGGNVAQTGYNLGAAAIQAVPQLSVSLATGGGSTGAQAINAVQSSGLGATIGNLSTKMVKDPQFWTSFMSMVGNEYQQAKADGASEAKATLYALGTSLFNAALESGGGIQTLPRELQGGKSAIRAWVDSMVDEGKEGAAQGIIERAMQNLVYGANNKVLSGSEIAKDFATEAAVGGILTAVPSIASSVRSNVGVNAQNTAPNATAPRVGVEGDTNSPTAQNATEGVVEANAESLYNKRDGNDGWGSKYSTAREALVDAINQSDSAFYSAAMAELDSVMPKNEEDVVRIKRGQTPINDAVGAVENLVRQDVISPMQAAKYLADSYKNGGVESLRAMVNIRNGNLYPAVEENIRAATQGDTPVINTTVEQPTDVVNSVGAETSASNDPLMQDASKPKPRFTDPLMEFVAGGKETLMPSAMEPGTKVKAADRDNIGTIVSRNEADGTYRVHFVSPDGAEATVTLPANQLTPIKSKAKTTTEVDNIETALEETIDPEKLAMEKINPSVEKTSLSAKEAASEGWSFFKRKIVDSGEAVSRIGKSIGDKFLYAYYNMARAAGSAGASMITDAQTDINGNVVGKSLNAIFEPIMAKGDDYYNKFQSYMLHLHNVARMTKGDKAKPVFDERVTAEHSQEIANRLLAENPEFAEYRNDIRNYINNLMQYRVDSGLITAADANFLAEYYPDYVPTYRMDKPVGGGGSKMLNAIGVGKTVATATGGSLPIKPLHTSLGEQTMQVVKEGSKNRFGLRLLSDYRNSNGDGEISQYIREANEEAAGFDPDEFDAPDTGISSKKDTEKKNSFTVLLGGNKHTLSVDNALFDAIKTLSPNPTENNVALRAVRSANNLFKALLTSYNPVFTVRNTVRDLQTAGLYSRDFASWARNYPKALDEIKYDGEMWKLYKSLGGDYSSVFDFATGTVKEPSTQVGKVVDKIQSLNMAMEQAPRLAEFMAVMENGDGSLDNKMDAMLAAADVTVNFGRSGSWGKILNSYAVPFFNPGVQGFDKMIRYATQSRTGREWLTLAVRAAALGIVPSVINALLYKDDEEWESLRDSDKDTNYMFKIGDGKWIKIPKGRELSILGVAVDRIGDKLKGEEIDWADTINTIGNQVAPANPLKTNIYSAINDTELFNPDSPGRTWYGGDIESQSMQNVAPGQRYDNSTDVLSKAVGGALNISPAKLNYLADQYTGVVGDVLLPLLTPQAERDMFTKAFVVDSVESNEIGGDFYDTKRQITYDRNAGDTTAAITSRYWNKVSNECSDINAKIREVQASTSLSDKEKRKQVRELKAHLNAVQQKALQNKERYEAAVNANLHGASDDAKDFAYREANREVFGAEYALQVYNKDVYAKAQEAAKNGANYGQYYDYYFATKGDTDKSKRQYLSNLQISKKAKTAIYFASLDSDAKEKYQKVHSETGITKEQYFAYYAALDVVDKPTESGNYGSYTKAEKQEAAKRAGLTGNAYTYMTK